MKIGVVATSTEKSREEEIEDVLKEKDAEIVLFNASHSWKKWEGVSGFILHGTNEISPETFGETPLQPHRHDWDSEVDKHHLQLIDFAVNLDKPILGIGTGFHLINIYFKGTLYQDVISQRVGALQHRNGKFEQSECHEVRLEKGGLFRKLYHNKEKGIVCSHHSQGIKMLGKELNVEATSLGDGLIEGIASKTHPLWGVQWDPFFPAPHSTMLEVDPLIGHFLTMC